MGNDLFNGVTPSEWPYPIKYDKENRIDVDVLVVGGGVAGAMAGIMAARRGVKVAVVEKSHIDISGSGGAGLDHYGMCISNPDCSYTPEEFIEALEGGRSFFSGDHRMYIQLKGTWDSILEMEKFGLRFRDEDDEFVGAPFRDDKTKIMYAYDYGSKSTIKIRSGADFKKYLRIGLVNEKNASIFERVMITDLLTDGGKDGARIVGATGVNEETGEFYVFSAKSVIICTSGVSMQGTQTWAFNLEMFGNGYRNDPRCTGDGVAMAWKAGAEFCSEEQFGQSHSTMPFGWPWYGIGNPDNTWFPCSIVDNNGKEMPWVDFNGTPLKSVDERPLPDKGGRFMSGYPGSRLYIDAEKIKSGEYELPLWADLAGMPEYERRCIWGLMVGNEGRTRTAIYDYFNKAGFNPERDMLQCPVTTPEIYQDGRKDFYQGEPGSAKVWKADTLKGVMTDWNQMTNVGGLFAAGMESQQGGAPGIASGGYAGNRAAEYAMNASKGNISESQVAKVKERVYAPVKRLGERDAVVNWKELAMGMNRVMQQDCGDFRSLALCKHGLMWLDSIKKHEMHQTYARNPHELVRVLESESKITVAEVYLHLCIANLKDKDSGGNSGKVMLNKFVDGELVTTYKEDKWWLKPPYAPTYLENYEKCIALEKEGK
ncbi:MAG: FAD-binding protein [Oscillospiraceae bacterium]|nr:FAD-binding protein [Oscillospiraceae bacterium]